MPDSRHSRLTLPLVVLAMIFPTLGAWLYFIGLAGSRTAGAAYLGAKVVQLGLPVAWILVAGWRPPPRWRPYVDRRQVAAGLLSGVALSLPIGLLYGLWLRGSPLAATVARRIGGKLDDFGIGTPLAYLGLAAALAVAHSLFEEVYWRWFVFGRLIAERDGAPRLRLGWAIALASLAFASHHLIVTASYAPPGRLWDLALPAALAVAVGGAVWCWLYHRSGSLAAPWISHLLVDVAVMAVGYDLVWRTPGQ